MLPTGPGDMFGPRHDYLDLLHTTMTASPTLLKLQSLLSSPYSDDVCRQTVAKYDPVNYGAIHYSSLYSGM